MIRGGGHRFGWDPQREVCRVFVYGLRTVLARPPLVFTDGVYGRVARTALVEPKEAQERNRGLPDRAS